MYDSLSDGDLLKEFLFRNCGHLLRPGFGPSDAMASTPLTHYPVSSGKSPVSPATYTSQAGVYVFTCIATGVFYIGSALCLNSRFKSHITNSSRPDRGGDSKFYRYVRAIGGWSAFTWGPLIVLPNYLILFVQLNMGKAINPQ